MIKQYSVAASGTVTAPDTQQDVQLVHNAAAVTLTVAFPATPIDGEKFGIAAIQAITTLTLSSALTIIGALTSMAIGGCATYMYNADSNKWVKIA